MASRTDYRQMTKDILRVLEEDKERTWQLDDLADRVKSAYGHKNLIRVKTMIHTMVASNRLNGRMNWNGVCDRVEWKAAEVSDSDRKLVTQLRTKMEEAIKEAEQAQAKMEEAVEAAKNVKAEERVVEVVLKKPGRKTKKIKAVFHKQFERLLRYVRRRENVFIYGPTGSGKSFICSQLAEAAGLSFSFVSCTAGMSEGVLGGRLLPTGKSGMFEYIISEFVKAYETGGVFLLDEMDAADPNVLLTINAALANGRMAVPNRKDKPYAEKHDDFVCVAACNTIGTGADRQYSGRNKLDAASIDRFIAARCYLDYDQQVEVQLCPDVEVRKLWWAIREAINENRLERWVSTRMIQKCFNALNHEQEELRDPIEDLLDSYFLGWSPDEKSKVKSYVAQHYAGLEHLNALQSI